MVFIYALQLQEGKYYIGKTNNPQIRLESHFNSIGSAWTNLYKPIKLLEIIPNCNDYDEDKYTRMYMDKYGIDNVRGGSFCSIKLDKTTHDHLEKMNRGTNNKCFTCGKEGHFANECEENEYWETVSEEDDVEDDEDDEDEYNYYSNCTNNCCYRCGRNNHYASSCYASTHVKGYYIK